MPVELLPASNPMRRRHHQPSNYPTRSVSEPQPSMSLTMKVLVVAALVGFGILHLIAGTIMQGASEKPPIETITFVHNGD